MPCFNQKLLFFRSHSRQLLFGGALLALSATFAARAAESPAPLTVSLQEALNRAQKYGTQIQSAQLLAELAREDRRQAKAATLPTVNGFNQFIYTEGNGTPSGVFVANDGVHVYNEQLQAHEELLALIRRGEVKVAEAAAVVAEARADVARRGLSATVIQNYYAVVVGARKVGDGERSLADSQKFLDITSKQEAGGETAHSDVIKAQLQVQQRKRDLSDLRVTAQKAKIALSVLIFPDMTLGFDVVDDLDKGVPLPSREATDVGALTTSPDLRAATAAARQAKLGVRVAQYGYLPSLGLDVFYGINANQFAANSPLAQDTGRSTLPNYLVRGRQNLGYSAQATLTIPLWNWGSTISKVKQASLRERQAELDLSATKRQLRADITTGYAEAEAATAQVESLRQSQELAEESLRLTVLRYQAGEATALEVADAQTTLTQARTAYDDGLLRQRVALANINILMGIPVP